LTRIDWHCIHPVWALVGLRPCQVEWSHGKLHRKFVLVEDPKTRTHSQRAATALRQIKTVLCPIHGVDFTVLFQFATNLLHKLHPTSLPRIVGIICSISKALPALRTFLRISITKLNTLIFRIKTILRPTLSAQSVLVGRESTSRTILASSSASSLCRYSKLRAASLSNLRKTSDVRSWSLAMKFANDGNPSSGRARPSSTSVRRSRAGIGRVDDGSWCSVSD
jgi:hypothetical protein